MTETTDQLIQARFDAVANAADGDWSDVLTRAHRRAAPRRRQSTVRLALAAAVVVVALATSAVAVGWPGAVVDFFQAPPAPQSVAHFFDTFNADVPSNMNPNATVGEPREVMTATFDANSIPPANDPTTHTLYVAPRTEGGFCFLWTDYGGGCADPQDAAAATTSPGARVLGVEWLAGDYATFVDGYVRGDAQTVEARFADGTSVTLPVTRVSAPIDAGFFAYNVPSSHWTTSDALASLVALDANGNVVGQDDIGVTGPLDQDVMQTLPDGTKYSLPRRAQAALATEPFNFDTADGGHAYLWVMPRTGGGSCYLFGTGAGGGFGCPAPDQLASEPAINGDEYGNGIYFAEVKPGIAALELEFTGGGSQRLNVVDGFVLGEISPAGSTLSAVVALDQSGNTVFTQRLGHH
jgi:hypothetical protein